MAKTSNPISKSLAVGIRAYQYVMRPILGDCCRFYPPCSDYALNALNVYGLLRGSYLTVCRIARCHPWNQGGFDPVPEKIK